MVKRTSWVRAGQVLAALGCAASAAGAAACIDDDHALTASRITVVDEYDGVWREGLELEVHAFDAETAEFLGCSDGPHENGGRFVKTRGLGERGSSGRWLNDLDVLDRQLVFVVTENDDAGCPDRYSYGVDEIAGVSGIVPGGTIAPYLSLAFDRVAVLSLELP